MLTSTLDKALQDEVLRRVGRNLLLFQQIERILKVLLSGHKVSGTSDDYLEKKEKQAARINKRMLGKLVKKYGTEVLRNAGAAVAWEDHPNPPPDSPWMSFSFHIACETGFIESVCRDLELMTEERNQLVHGFLPRWQPESADKMNETLRYLDEQREKVLPIYEHLRGVLNGMRECGKRALEFVQSEEFDRLSELIWLQDSPLVVLLRNAASQIQRKDGWTYLAYAGRLAHERLPDEIREIKDRYGVLTLRQLLLAAEVFDILDEPISGGGFRTLYRVKTSDSGL